MSDQPPDDGSLLAFTNFRYDGSNPTSTSISSTTSAPSTTNPATQIPSPISANQQPYFHQDMMSTGYYDQMYKQPPGQQQPQPFFQGSAGAIGYPYTPIDLGSLPVSGTQGTTIFSGLPVQQQTHGQQQHHQPTSYSPNYGRYQHTHHSVNSPSSINQQQPQQQNRYSPTSFSHDQPMSYAGSQHGSEHPGGLPRQFQFPPPTEHRHRIPQHQHLTPPSPPVSQSQSENVPVSAGGSSGFRPQPPQQINRQAQPPFSYVPTIASVSPVHGGNTRSRGPRRRRTGSKRSLEDMILDSIIPTITTAAPGTNTERKGPAIGLLTGSTSEGLISPSIQGMPQGATAGPILPLTLTDPPFASATPINPNAFNSDPQQRPKKKSKYTSEQDAVILQMKKEGKTWSEISQAAQCGNSLAARNRYQVLIGQQGGGAFMWDSHDALALKELLEDGEWAKWDFIASELGKIRSVHVSNEMCRQKIKELFDRDPTYFGVTLGISAEAAGQYESYMGPAPGMGGSSSLGAPPKLPADMKPPIGFAQLPHTHPHQSQIQQNAGTTSSAEIVEYARSEFDFSMQKD